MNADRQRTALFAGSFDPFTIGHEAIVRRGLEIFDRIIIGIGYNENKHGTWTPDERLEAIRGLYSGEPRVNVELYTGLTVDYAVKSGARFLLRGVRGAIDFEYERNLADINRAISGIETVILISEPDMAIVSSSMVRELLHNGYDISRYVAGNFIIKSK